MEKPFLLSDGRVGLEGRLDRAVYGHGDSITVHVNVNNNSSKSVRRIKVRGHRERILSLHQRDQRERTNERTSVIGKFPF